MKLKTFFDPCQTHLLYMKSLNLYPLSTLCTLQSITFTKSIFYYAVDLVIECPPPLYRYGSLEEDMVFWQPFSGFIFRLMILNNFCVENFVLCVRISNIQGVASRVQVKSTVQKLMSYRVEIDVDGDGDDDDDGSRGNCNDINDINDVSFRIDNYGQMNQML